MQKERNHKKKHPLMKCHPSVLVTPKVQFTLKTTWAGVGFTTSTYISIRCNLEAGGEKHQHRKR